MSSHRSRHAVRWVSAALGPAALTIWVAAAGAFAAPVLYVRADTSGTTVKPQTRAWLPLASAPSLNWLGGYDIGYAYQPPPAGSGFEVAALQITTAPGGKIFQPHNTPYCAGESGSAGEIVEVGTKIRFQGSGRYGVTVSVGPSPASARGCLSGAASASSSGTFSVAVPVGPKLVGHPQLRSAKPRGRAFVGVRTTPPLGGAAETRCALNATIRPDGSVAGKIVAPPASQKPNFFTGASIDEFDFPLPGAWTCVARGIAEGDAADLSRTIFGTPWSKPLRFTLRSGFARSHQTIAGPHSAHPQLSFTAEFAAIAAGGTGRLKLARQVRCRGTHPVLAPVATYSGRFNHAGRATITIRRPADGFYVGTLSFSGTRFYTKSTDSNPVLLSVAGGALRLVAPARFPRC